MFYLLRRLLIFKCDISYLESKVFLFFKLVEFCCHIKDASVYLPNVYYVFHKIRYILANSTLAIARLIQDIYSTLLTACTPIHRNSGIWYTDGFGRKVFFHSICLIIIKVPLLTSAALTYACRLRHYFKMLPLLLKNIPTTQKMFPIKKNTY